MKTCSSCGGIIGRDCFNPIECAWITQQINNQYAVDDFVQRMNDDYEREQQEKAERAYYEHVEEQYNDAVSECLLEANPILNRFLQVV